MRAEGRGGMSYGAVGAVVGGGEGAWSSASREVEVREARCARHPEVRGAGYDTRRSQACREWPIRPFRGSHPNRLIWAC